MKRILFLAFFVSPAFAVDTDTHKYIVYVEKIPSVTDLKGLGFSNTSQPLDNMQFIVVKNTQVVIQELVFKDDTEQSLYDQMEKNGQAYQYEISREVMVDGFRDVEKVMSNPIPVDLNKDWAIVEKSSQVIK